MKKHHWKKILILLVVAVVVAGAVHYFAKGKETVYNETEVKSRTIETYYSDIDINGHVNSIKYIEHILDLFPREKFTGQGIRRFEIAYKTEAYMGDRLNFYLQPVDENEFDVEVRKNESETVCQAKICFK